MATTCKIAAQEVRVGQVWADNDPRNAGVDRKIEVVSFTIGFAQCKNVRTGKITNIKLERFRPTRSGYRLVQSVTEFAAEVK